MMESNQNLNVAGKGFAEWPVPFWLKLVRSAFALGVALCVAAVLFNIGGWSLVTDTGADGFSLWFAVWGVALVLISMATPVIFSKLGMFRKLFNVRRAASGDRWVFGGFRSSKDPAAILLSLAAVYATAALGVYRAVVTCPLPEMLTKASFEIMAPNLESGAESEMAPIYFWDYATWMNPDWLNEINIILPYEKGPPQKLLPKIYFEDAKTHAIVLELHGRRPRQYKPETIYGIFEQPVVHPRDWPLVWRLEREAGLTTEGLNAAILYLLRINQGGSSRVTQAIGVPWDTRGSTPRPDNGRFFYWGPDGSVFQVKCPSPCRMARLLELVQFPEDPRGSHQQRLAWTKDTIRKLLETSKPGQADRKRENLLSLYLLSLLTIDPRDPEAYFHLGKLARNRETVVSAIRYGRDVGMDPAKLMELQAAADRDFEN